MRIVLRDDDTCFYTSPSDLETAFGDLPDVPVSISVIPYAAYEHRGTFPYKPAPALDGYVDIADNHFLVSYLKEQITNGHFSLMLHAIHHEYHPRSDDEWDTEMDYLSYDQIYNGIKAGKKHLEQLFDVDISTFIGASNVVSANCAASLDELGLHTNYMVSKKFNRRFTIHNVINYLRCNLYRAVTHRRYYGVLRYRRHCEIGSCPFESFSKAKEQYAQCKKAGHPLVIYTHYWSLNAHPEEKADLLAFVKWAIADGAEFIAMDQLWR